MYRKGWCVLPTLVAAWVVMVSGCQPEPVGSVHIVGTFEQAASDVTRVSVTLTAADQEPLTVELVKVNSDWRGSLERIPADKRCTFTTEGFGADGTKRYAGKAMDIYLTSGEAIQLVITLRPFVSGP